MSSTNNGKEGKDIAGVQEIANSATTDNLNTQQDLQMSSLTQPVHSSIAAHSNVSNQTPPKHNSEMKQHDGSSNTDMNIQQTNIGGQGVGEQKQFPPAQECHECNENQNKNKLPLAKCLNFE